MVDRLSRLLLTGLVLAAGAGAVAAAPSSRPSVLIVTVDALRIPLGIVWPGRVRAGVVGGGVEHGVHRGEGEVVAGEGVRDLGELPERRLRAHGGLLEEHEVGEVLGEERGQLGCEPGEVAAPVDVPAQHPEPALGRGHGASAAGFARQHRRRRPGPS